MVLPVMSLERKHSLAGTGIESLARQVMKVAQSAAPGVRRSRLRMGHCNFECSTDHAAHFFDVEHFVPWKTTPVELSDAVRYSIDLRVVPDLTIEVVATLANLQPASVHESYVGRCHHARYHWGADDQFFLIETGPTPADRSYCICRNGQKIFIIAASSTVRFPSYALRTLREIYLRESENRGAAMIHAAAVARRDRAVLIAGDKATGKTTLALALCAGRHVSFLGNDRVLLARGRREFVTFPFPLSCRIGMGTANQVPPVGELLNLPAPFYPRDNALRSAQGDDIRRRLQFGSTLKMVLTQLELTSGLRVEHHAGARLSRILLPQLEPERTDIVVEAVSPDELGNVLKTQLLTPCETEWPHPWLIDHQCTPESIHRTASELVAVAARQIRGYRLKFGFNYWRDGSAEPRLVSALGV